MKIDGRTLPKAAQRKFTGDQVVRIRAQHAGGTSLSQLSRDYGTGYEVMRRIVSGRTYAEVPMPGAAQSAMAEIRAVREMVRELARKLAADRGYNRMTTPSDHPPITSPASAARAPQADMDLSERVCEGPLAIQRAGGCSEGEREKMSQHRELRRLIVGDGETRICSFDAADRILAAGWRRIPPGGTEWGAMVDRAVAEYDGADACDGADEAMEAALRAALRIER